MKKALIEGGVLLKKLMMVRLMCVILFSIPIAQADSLSFAQVLRANFSATPELGSAQLQVDMRQLDGLAAEGLLDTMMMASLGMRDETAPTTSPFAATGTNASFVSGQVVKPLADGSTLTASVQYNRAELSYPSSVALGFQSSINPVYQHQIDVIYRYPLWRGAGHVQYNTQKEAAAYAEKAAVLQVIILKEQLASQGIALYFQHILNHLSLSLADDAVVRAQQLLAYQRKREQFGLIERADRLQASALLATRQLQRVQAVGARNQGQTALNRFMFQAEDTTLQPVFKHLTWDGQNLTQHLQQAKMKRPMFAMLDAQAAAAAVNLRLAQAEDEQQLDIVGQVGSRALHGDAATALTQGLTLNDRYLALRIEFSDSLNHSASRVGIQRHVLAMESIKFERKKYEASLKSDLANIDARLQSSQAILIAAKALVGAEQAKFKAEMTRYREGRSNTAMVTQFEGELRAAQLRLTIEQVALHQASYQLALVKGELLSLMGLAEVTP